MPARGDADDSAPTSASSKRSSPRRSRSAPSCRARSSTMKRDAETTWAAERVENALLRERINDVAAEVARLTAALEGPGSPIESMLADAVPGLDRGQRRRHQRRRERRRLPRSSPRSRARARSPTASAPCSRPPRAWRRIKLCQVIFRRPEVRAKRASKGDASDVGADSSRAASRPPQDDGHSVA